VGRRIVLLDDEASGRHLHFLDLSGDVLGHGLIKTPKGLPYISAHLTPEQLSGARSAGGRPDPIDQSRQQRDNQTNDQGRGYDQDGHGHEHL
jgi:hypothetical protein